MGGDISTSDGRSDGRYSTIREGDLLALEVLIQNSAGMVRNQRERDEGEDELNQQGACPFLVEHGVKASQAARLLNPIQISNLVKKLLTSLRCEAKSGGVRNRNRESEPIPVGLSREARLSQPIQGQGSAQNSKGPNNRRR